MFRILSYFLGLPAVLMGGLWLWNSNFNVSQFVQKYVGNHELQTLEARYTADQIMENQKKTLLKDSKYSYHNASLKFCPYALLEVKYSKDSHATAEGILLWSLADGEIVLDTESWQITHGFEDCINAKADKNDFKLLKALSKSRKTSLDKDSLIKELRIEEETLDLLIDSCRQKKLIVQKGNEYRLHFSNPKLTTTPETKINQWLVTKPYKDATCIAKKYTLSQIETAAKAAFDNDFTIRDVSEVYLPIYSIVVQNPDNSLLTTHWNALNGKRIEHLKP